MIFCLLVITWYQFSNSPPNREAKAFVLAASWQSKGSLPGISAVCRTWLPSTNPVTSAELGDVLLGAAVAFPDVTHALTMDHVEIPQNIRSKHVHYVRR